MAITLGTFTKFDNGAFTGTLKTLHVTAAVTIVPVDKMSDNAPDHRVFAGQRHEIGAGWSQVAKSSGETTSTSRSALRNSGRPGFAAASSSSSSRPKTAPPTSPFGSRATAKDHWSPPTPSRATAAGFFLSPSSSPQRSPIGAD